MNILTILLAIVAVTIVFDIIYMNRVDNVKTRTAKKLFDLNNEIRDAARSGDTKTMQASLNEYENVLHKLNHRFTSSPRFPAVEKSEL